MCACASVSLRVRAARGRGERGRGGGGGSVGACACLSAWYAWPPYTSSLPRGGAAQHLPLGERRELDGLERERRPSRVLQIRAFELQRRADVQRASSKRLPTSAVQHLVRMRQRIMQRTEAPSAHEPPGCTQGSEAPKRSAYAHTHADPSEDRQCSREAGPWSLLPLFHACALGLALARSQTCSRCGLTVAPCPGLGRPSASAVPVGSAEPYSAESYIANVRSAVCTRPERVVRCWCGCWAGASRVPVQMWAGAGRVPVQMWTGAGRVPVQMWAGAGRVPVQIWAGAG
jgi:hypothetical protein